MLYDLIEVCVIQSTFSVMQWAILQHRGVYSFSLPGYFSECSRYGCRWFVVNYSPHFETSQT